VQILGIGMCRHDRILPFKQEHMLSTPPTLHWNGLVTVLALARLAVFVAFVGLGVVFVAFVGLGVVFVAFVGLVVGFFVALDLVALVGLWVGFDVVLLVGEVVGPMFGACTGPGVGFDVVGALDGLLSGEAVR